MREYDASKCHTTCNHDSSDTDLIPTIIEVVDGAAGEPARADAGPLYDAVDPDALESVVTTAALTGSDLRVGFEYAACQVVVGVTANGELQVDARRSTPPGEEAETA